MKFNIGITTETTYELLKKYNLKLKKKNVFNSQLDLTIRM
jgi:hypothetical protein